MGELFASEATKTAGIRRVEQCKRHHNSIQLVMRSGQVCRAKLVVRFD